MFMHILYLCYILTNNSLPLSYLLFQDKSIHRLYLCYALTNSSLVLPCILSYIFTNSSLVLAGVLCHIYCIYAIYLKQLIRDVLFLMSYRLYLCCILTNNSLVLSCAPTATKDCNASAVKARTLHSSENLYF